MTKQFEAAVFEIYLAPDRHDINGVVDYSGQRHHVGGARGYADKQTGELMFKLIAALAVKAWVQAERHLAKILEIEMGKRHPDRPGQAVRVKPPRWR